MKRLLAATAAAVVLTGFAAAPPAYAQGAPASARAGLNVDMQYFTLPNGLRVVLHKDSSVPTVAVGTYYGIGFRIEPRDRTGFAHLFEHLMFQGSGNAPKGVFDSLITNSGGVNNGSTRFDFTNYYETVPSNALEAVLWIEGDRMARPVIDETVLKNQQGVVANEVKVNVLNQPYGGWPWLDMPQLANTNWFNAHNFYGDLADLEAATVADAKSFFDQFYRPNNAVLVITGDIDYAAARKMVEKYFGPIPRGEPVKLPDISEPRQTEEKFKIKPDPLAPRPAYSVAWHVPARGTPEWYAMGLLDQALVQGDDSRLYRKLVQEKAITGGVQGGINIGLGNMFNYNGPMLWTVAFVHDANRSRDEITGALDEVVEDVRKNGLTQAELDRARTKMRAQLARLVDDGTRWGLLDLLAVHALFDDDPTKVNRIEDGFAAVTPELVQKVAQEYLRPTNRSILVVQPAPKTPAAAPAGPTAAPKGAE